MSIRLFPLFIAVVLASACGSKPATAPAPTAPTTAPTTATASTEVHFDDMDRESKIAHMKTVVMPAMTTLFQSFDADHYDALRCEFCHGPGANAGKFEMPNPDLPKLNPADSFKAHMTESPEMTEFMMQRVVPEMARLLGEEPYNAETGKGIGCFTCHTMDQGE